MSLPHSFHRQDNSFYRMVRGRSGTLVRISKLMRPLLIRILNRGFQDCKPTGPFFAAFCHFLPFFSDSFCSFATCSGGWRCVVMGVRGLDHSIIPLIAIRARRTQIRASRLLPFRLFLLCPYVRCRPFRDSREGRGAGERGGGVVVKGNLTVARRGPYLAYLAACSAWAMARLRSSRRASRSSSEMSDGQP